MTTTETKRKQAPTDYIPVFVKKIKTEDGALPSLWSGQRCPPCKLNIYDVEKTIFFIGCGHIFHQKCLQNPNKCPVCQCDVTEENRVLIAICRVVKNLLPKSAIERRVHLDKTTQYRIRIEECSLKEFFYMVSEMVYKRRMPIVEAICLYPCRLFTQDFVMMPNERVQIALLTDNDNLKKKWQLFDVMWKVWISLVVHTQEERDEVFKRLLSFEDTLKLVKVDEDTNDNVVCLL